MLRRRHYFTEGAQHALALAREEAEDLGQRAVGTGHLLLGLLRAREGLAAGMLADWGVDAPAVRAMLTGLLGRGERRSFQDATLSPATQRAIDLAREEAAALAQPLVGTEHLLLGILLVEEDVGAVILERHDVWLRHVHREIRRRGD